MSETKLISTPCSLRALLPGHWSRPYKRSPHVWEDSAGNRAIIGYAINYLTLRAADGTPGGCYDHEEPFRSALKRNPNRRRAGLAAARRFFEANDPGQAPAHATPNTVE